MKKKLTGILLVFTLLFAVQAIQPASVSAAAVKTKATLYVGEITTLKASQAATYQSSDKKVATVTAKGLVTAKKAGKVTITATSKSDRKVIATCSLTVKKAPKTKQITLKAKSGTVNVGKTVQIAVKSVKGVSSKALTYTSSNKSIATVDKNGLITGVSEGSAKITVKAACNPKVKATYSITVSIDRLSYEDFDVSGFYDGGIKENNKLYANYIDYAKDGGSNTYYVTYYDEDPDVDYKTFTTARGIMIGSAKSAVAKAYSSLDQDASANKNNEDFMKIVSGFDCDGHTVCDVLKYFYKEDDMTYTVSFLFDQCEKVMAITFEGFTV
jgi:hypothetical protein